MPNSVGDAPESVGEAKRSRSGGTSRAGKPPHAPKRGRRKKLAFSERVGRWHRLAQGAFCGGLCALMVAMLGWVGRTQGLEGAVLDSLFQARNWRGPRYPSPDVAVVVVDDDTVARYGQYPLPRRYFTQLVKYLQREGARTIAFDISFSTRGHAAATVAGEARVDVEEEDRKFAQACAEAGNVLHAAGFYRLRDASTPWAPQAQEAQPWSSQAEAQTTQPSPRFAWPEFKGSRLLDMEEALGAFSARPVLQKTAAGLGHITVFPEQDYGTLRRIPHFIRFRGCLYPSLALATALNALRLKPSDVSLDGDGLRLGKERGAPRIPLQGQASETLVNWIGGYESFTTYPLWRVLSAKEAPEPGSFRGKVVLVGAVNAGAFELRTTPFASLQPAVEMQANAVDDILTGRLLREVPRSVHLALLWLMPIGLGVLVAGRTARSALCLTVATMAAVSGVALALFHANIYWPFASSLLAMGGTALFCVSLRQARDAAHLQTAQQRYALAVDAANDGIWDWDLASGHVYYAQRWKSLLGYGVGDVKPRLRAWLDLVHPDDLAAVERALQSHLQGRAPGLNTEFRMLHRDGSWRWMLARGLTVRGQDGAPTRMAGSLSDITLRREAEQKLRLRALSDELTGLPNRAFFLESLQKCIARAQGEPGFGFAVLFLDLDRFKIVNDSLGHLMGDEMLQAVARRLEDCLRPGDVVARMGGDEFTLLMHGIRSPDEATALAERLQEKLNAPLQIGGHDFSTSASIGIALADSATVQASLPTPQVLEEPQGALLKAELSEGALAEPLPGPCYAHAEELLRDADTAMYSAKSAGRARYAVFDAAMHARALAQLRLETALRRAIAQEKLHLCFQPIVDLQGMARHGEPAPDSLKGARVTGFEALVRWSDPERGSISPGEFIPFAEESGLIVPLDKWVLREACFQTRAWMDATGRDDLCISVNLSGKRFEQPDLVESIQQVLEESRLPARCLRLEITESVVMGNARSAVQTLERLKSLGLSLAVDDFGTGYSSLAYLHRFPIDVLKVDRSFVMRIAPGGDNGAIVQAIINLARSLSLSVVAEGVEEDYQAALLRSLGCEYGQGFFFAKPLEASEAALLLGAPRPALEAARDAS